MVDKCRMTVRHRSIRKHFRPTLISEPPFLPLYSTLPLASYSTDPIQFNCSQISPLFHATIRPNLILLLVLLAFTAKRYAVLLSVIIKETLPEGGIKTLPAILLKIHSLAASDTKKWRSDFNACLHPLPMQISTPYSTLTATN